MDVWALVWYGFWGLVGLFFLFQMYQRIVFGKEKGILLKALRHWLERHQFKYQPRKVKWDRHLFPYFEFFSEFAREVWYDLSRQHRVVGIWKGFDFEVFTMELKNQTHVSHGFTRQYACVLIMDAGIPVPGLERPDNLPAHCRFEVRGRGVMLAYENVMFWDIEDLEKHLNLIERSLSVSVSKAKTR